MEKNDLRASSSDVSIIWCTELFFIAFTESENDFELKEDTKKCILKLPYGHKLRLKIIDGSRGPMGVATSVNS